MLVRESTLKKENPPAKESGGEERMQGGKGQ
jgi:hypothetical protein